MLSTKGLKATAYLPLQKKTKNINLCHYGFCLLSMRWDEEYQSHNKPGSFEEGFRRSLAVCGVTGSWPASTLLHMRMSKLFRKFYFWHIVLTFSFSLVDRYLLLGSVLKLQMFFTVCQWDVLDIFINQMWTIQLFMYLIVS